MTHQNGLPGSNKQYRDLDLGTPKYFRTFFDFLLILYMGDFYYKKWPKWQFQCGFYNRIDFWAKNGFLAQKIRFLNNYYISHKAYLSDSSGSRTTFSTLLSQIKNLKMS